MVQDAVTISGQKKSPLMAEVKELWPDILF
jgi:hypothetical protein